MRRGRKDRNNEKSLCRSCEDGVPGTRLRREKIFLRRGYIGVPIVNEISQGKFTSESSRRD